MTVADILKEHTDGLVYISETDSPVSVWQCVAKKPRVLSPSSFLELVGGLYCTDEPFADWWKHTIYSQGISQGAKVKERYEDLHESLFELLYPRYIFKVKLAPNRYAFYSVGISSPVDGSNLVGVKMEAVNT